MHRLTHYLLILLLWPTAASAAPPPAPTTNTVTVILTNGLVEVSRATPDSWSPASTVTPQSLCHPLPNSIRPPRSWQPKAPGFRSTFRGRAPE